MPTTLKTNVLVCGGCAGAEKVNADPTVAHLTATLCHLGNLTTRFGRSLEFDPRAEQIVGDEEASRLVARTYRDHWGRRNACDYRQIPN
jgi:hypothetical protein